MIKVNHDSYRLAQEHLATGRCWRVDPDAGLLRVSSRQPAGTPNVDGYMAVSFARDGRKMTVFAHRVVWEALRGPIPPGMYVNHIDGDKTNNALANLELVTHAQNMTHAKATGLLAQRRSFAGEANPSAKLTEADVRDVRARIATGHGVRRIAASLGVSLSVVSDIKNGRSWSHLI